MSTSPGRNSLLERVTTFARRLALFYAVAYVNLLVVGTVLLIAEPHGDVAASWEGPAPAQVFFWSVGWMTYLVLWAAPPALALGLALQGAISRHVGHPRLVAIAIGLAAIVAIVGLVPRNSPLLIIALAAPVVIVYALLAPWPPRQSATRH